MHCRSLYQELRMKCDGYFGTPNSIIRSTPRKTARTRTDPPKNVRSLPLIVRHRHHKCGTARRKLFAATTTSPMSQPFRYYGRRQNLVARDRTDA